MKMTLEEFSDYVPASISNDLLDDYYITGNNPTERNRIINEKFLNINTNNILEFIYDKEELRTQYDVVKIIKLNVKQSNKRLIIFRFYGQDT